MTTIKTPPMRKSLIRLYALFSGVSMACSVVAQVAPGSLNAPPGQRLQQLPPGVNTRPIVNGSPIGNCSQTTKCGTGGVDPTRPPTPPRPLTRAVTLPQQNAPAPLRVVPARPVPQRAR